MINEKSAEDFLKENENKTADEMLDMLAENMFEANPSGLKASMRKAGYDVDSMESFEGIDG